MALGDCSLRYFLNSQTLAYSYLKYTETQLFYALILIVVADFRKYLTPILNRLWIKHVHYSMRSIQLKKEAIEMV